MAEDRADQVRFLKRIIWEIYNGSQPVKEFMDRNTGIIAAAAFAFSPFLLFYSQEARAYSVMLFFVTFSMVFYFRALKSNTFPDWAAFGLLSALPLFLVFWGTRERSEFMERKQSPSLRKSFAMSASADGRRGLCASRRSAIACSSARCLKGSASSNSSTGRTDRCRTTCMSRRTLPMSATPGSRTSSGRRCARWCHTKQTDGWSFPVVFS